LRDLDTKSRKALLTKLSKKRKVLNKRLRQLTSKRDKFIATETAEKSDSFDAEVMKQVKAKAAKYGVAY
ncbi:MAG: VWA domain-containing protein, partial [Myxococcota bacterium]|nr:VWA domain-containing protein [Myxococcota bacterium]